MATILAGIVVFVLLFAAMAIGVIVSGRPLGGGCAGKGAGNRCGACRRDRNRGGQ